MNKQIVKEITNFALVIVFTFVHIFFLAPIINEFVNGRLLSIGVWCIVVGVWGNFVGVRLVKPLVISKDYKKENYFFIILGIALAVIGLYLSFS